MKTIAVILALASVAEFGNKAIAADWVEYSSDNFTVLSDARPADVYELLEKLELFRRATFVLMNLPDVPEAEQLVVVVFDRAREYSRLNPAPNYVTQFFYHSISGPRMLIGPGRGFSRTQSLIFHRYAHYLMDQHVMVNFPRWFSEGLADLLSSAEIADDEISIGNAPRGYLSAIAGGFVEEPLSEIVDIGYRGSSSDFLPMSWLLTHYLLLDAENAPLRRDSLLAYLQRYDDGEDPIEAFTQSFGMEPREVEYELRLYAQRHTLTGIKLPREPYAGEQRQRVLPEQEALYRLGDLAVEVDGYDAAHRYFDDFVELESGSPLSTRVEASRAIAYIHERLIDDGDALMTALHASETTDAAVLADISHYAYDRFLYETAERDEPDADLARTNLERAINFGARAVEGNPEDVEALFYLGLAYEADGQLQLAVDTLSRSYDINPSVLSLQIALVRVLIKGRQPDAASYLLSRLYSASHSEEARETIREVQRQIAEGDVDLSLLDGNL